ncbi:MAG: phosphate regulon sensor histidine kinase PhoR [Sulfuricellaceae bacterium]|nr:phosphate regulon sensor histidine kinase PhoR [Sulfuricellaceae bacterium]
MTGFWWRPLITLALVALLALGLWAIEGAATALALFSGLLLAHFFVDLAGLRQMDLWLRRPTVETLPHGFGLWEDIFAGLYKLVRFQSSSQSRLAADLERFQNAASAIPDGIVVLNEMDQIDWCNPMAETHFNFHLNNDRGRQIAFLLRLPPFVAYLATQQYKEPLILKSPRNRDITLSIQLIPFGNRQKLLLSRDVTQLERVETVRRDFIANVSHELRTPLTVIGGFLETLADADHIDRTQWQGYFRLMQDQAGRMQRLVEDLLTLSRLESPQHSLQEDRVEVHALLQTVYSEAQSLSGGQHDIRLEEGSPCVLLGNENELRSAFSNLVSNAVRYTPDGGRILLRWQRQANGEGLFSVEDTGEGIEEKHITRLTERFYRVDRSRSRDTGGTGLGLSIVKHVLTRHQARLEITSQLGKGSCFSVRFPAQRVVQAPGTEPHQPSPT